MVGLLVQGVAPEARAGVDAQVSLLLGNAVKPNGFAAVGVELRTDAPWRGTIRAARRRGGQAEVALPVEVGRGVFRFDFSVPTGLTPEADDLVVRIEDARGRPVREEELTCRTIGWNQWGHATAQSAILLAVWPDGRVPNAGLEEGIAHTSARTERLPSDWRLYWAVDVLMMPGTAAAALRPEQAQAILAWVRTGGRLVMDGACPDDKAEGQALFRGLGLTLGERVAEAVLERSVPVTPVPGVTLPPAPGSNTETRVVRVAAPFRALRAGTADCSDPARPRAVLDLGLGQVVLSGLDLAALARNPEPGAAAAGLGWLIGGDPASPPPGGKSYYDTMLYRHGSMLGSVAWSQSLYRMVGLKPIPAGWVIGYLLVFIGLVCPLERVVLRRAARPHWMWWTTPLLALAFCLAADAAALAVRGVSARRSSVCVHHYAAGGGGTHATLDCFVPSRGRSTLALEGPDGIIFDVPSRGTSVRYDPRAGAFAFASPVWSPHFLASLRAHEEPPPLAVEVAIRDGAPTGGVRAADARWRLREAFLTWNGRDYPLTRDGDRWVLGKPGATTHRLEVLRPGRHSPWNGPPGESSLMWLRDSAAGRGGGAVVLEDFQPAPVPVLACGTNLAVVTAECEEGPVLNLTGENSVLTARHVIRQVAPLSAAGAAGGRAAAP